jgi:glycosyltransferase involved in cell wall biosynthesis
MERAKIFLHPSSYEGYSTVCLEALFAGCHVVSFTSAQNSAIDHWHVAADTDGLIGACIDLAVHKPDYTPVLVNTMDESARRMVALFRNQKQTRDFQKTVSH